MKLIILALTAVSGASFARSRGWPTNAVVVATPFNYAEVLGGVRGPVFQVPSVVGHKDYWSMLRAAAPCAVGIGSLSEGRIA